MALKVVVVEDEADVAKLVSHHFEKEGFEVASFASGSEALKYLERHVADAVVLDVMLPGEDGLEICKQMRANLRLRSLPLVFLTARSAEVDRIVGLEIGGDDYVTKPFSPRELVVRVKAVLRPQLQPPPTTELLQAGALRIDPQTLEVFVGLREVLLSPLEFRLLYFLASHPGRVFRREVLLHEIWGRDSFDSLRTVDVHIRRIRQKIEAQPDRPVYLQTLRGTGYCFRLPAEDKDTPG